MKNICIGILGFGTVGKGAFDLLKENSQKFEDILGKTISVKKILVRDSKKYGSDAPNNLFTQNFEDIVSDSQIDIVLELIGGQDKAYEYIKAALEAKKHVVTANKDLIANKGNELLNLADTMGVKLLFEGAVGGAIPVINTIRNDLFGNRITKVMGIINGTTNYMLTKMYHEGVSFQEILKEAQDLGYAESDPTADVEGLDAARKIAILASVSFNSTVVFDDVFVEGITKIESEDIQYAKKLNSSIKLLGIAVEKNGVIEARVHPTLIPLSHPLGKVDDVYNAVYLEGNGFGDLTLLGKGAGGYPTASAVLGDTFLISKSLDLPLGNFSNCSCKYDLEIADFENIESSFYVRLIVEDKIGVMAKIAKVLGDNQVSMDSIIQNKLEDNKAELVLLTDEVSNKFLFNSLDDMKKLDFHCEIRNVIRCEK